MKRFIVMLTLLFTMYTTTAFASTTEYKVFIDNKEVEMDSRPDLYRGSTFVPISFIAKELGATVNWESPNVTIKKDDTTLVLTVGSNAYTKNGELRYSQYQPFIVNGRTYVPLRFVSNIFGYPVSYEHTNDRTENSGRNYTTTYSINIDTSKQAIIENNFVDDNSSYTISPNGKYGIKSHRYNGSMIKNTFDTPKTNSRIEAVYLKNMETGEFKELYFTSAHSGAYWTADNKIILSGHEDINGGKSRSHFMIYDPMTDKFKNIVDAHYGFYYEPTNSFMYSTTEYRSDATSDEGSKVYAKDLNTGKVTTITKDEYYEFREVYNKYRGFGRK